MAEYTLFLLLIISLSIQTIFWIFIFQKLPSTHKKSSSFLPPVSIIIAARNEAKNLNQLLPKLAALDYPSFEIIIVNDRSVDRSSEVLATFQQSIRNLKVITISTIENNLSPKKNALTKGINKASHDWLLFTDADCIPHSSQWIKEMISVIKEETSIVLGASTYLRENSLLNQFIQFETSLTLIQYASFQQWGQPYMGVGRNLMYHKRLFKESNGFASHQHILSGDDDLFVSQNATSENCQINIRPNARTISKPKQSWSSYFKQKTRHLTTGKHYRLSTMTLLGLFNLSYILFFLSTIFMYFINPFFSICLHLIRILIIGFSFLSFRKRLYLKLNFAMLLVLDVLYFLYISTIGFVGSLFKNVRWK